MSNTTSNPGSRTWAIIGALVLGCVAVTVLVALYAWQADRRDAKLQEADKHAQAVIDLEDAAADIDITGELIVAYVAQGDDSLIPQIQQHSEAALIGITSALSTSSSDVVSAIARDGSALSDGAGKIIALRKIGDAEAAGATLEELRSSFDSFGAALDAATNEELETAASLQTDADNADQTASWLLITAMAVGVATGGGLLYVVVSSLFRRGVPESATPA